MRFREDPVRILRAAKFAGRLGFSIEPETFAAMAETSGDLVRSAAPRVYEEILRLLRGGHSLESFQLLRDVGALQYLVPVLAEFLAKARHDERVQFWRLLEALDHRIQDTETVPCNAVLLGVLLVGPVLARVERAPGRSASSIAEDLLSPLCQALKLPRRDAGCLKRICGVQHRFLQDDDSKRFRIAGFVHGPYFAEAFELFELRMQALGQHAGAVSRWRELGEDLGEPTDADLPASLFDGDGGETMPRVGSGGSAESEDDFERDDDFGSLDSRETDSRGPRHGERDGKRGPGSRHADRSAAQQASWQPASWQPAADADEFSPPEDAAPEHLDDLPPDALPRGARGADAMRWDGPTNSPEADEDAALRPWSQAHTRPPAAPRQRAITEVSSEPTADVQGAPFPGDSSGLTADGDGSDPRGRRRRRRKRRRGRGQDTVSADPEHDQPADGPFAAAADALAEPEQQPLDGASEHATAAASPLPKQPRAPRADDYEADLPPLPATAGPDADDGDEDGEIELPVLAEDGEDDEGDLGETDSEASDRDSVEPVESERAGDDTESEAPNATAEGSPTEPAGERDGRRRRRRRRRGRRGGADYERFPPSEPPHPHGDPMPHGAAAEQGLADAEPGLAQPRVGDPDNTDRDTADLATAAPEAGTDAEDDSAAGGAEGRNKRRRRRGRRRGRGDEQQPERDQVPGQPAQQHQQRAPQQGSQGRQQAPRGHDGQRQRQDGKRQDGQKQRQGERQHAQHRQDQNRQAQNRPDQNRPGEQRHGQRDRKAPRDVAVVPRHHDRRGKVEVLEPTPLDLSAFDVELDPKRVPTFGSIVEGGNRPKKRSPRVPEDGIDDYRPPPPPGSDAPPVPPPPPSGDDSPDTFGDW